MPERDAGKQKTGFTSAPNTGAPTHDDKERISTFVHSRRWTTAFCHKWKRKEHINALEATTAVLALEWAVSFEICGHRIVLLSDSLVANGALSKGRSSSARLCLACRRFAALSVAHDVDAVICHVPSSLNPAEGPSRPSSGSNE